MVTELTELLDSPLLDSVPLDCAPLDSLLDEDDSLVGDSPELVVSDDSPEELLAVGLVAAVLLFFEAAESAGS